MGWAGLGWFLARGSCRVLVAGRRGGEARVRERAGGLAQLDLVLVHRRSERDAQGDQAGAVVVAHLDDRAGRRGVHPLERDVADVRAALLAELGAQAGALGRARTLGAARLVAVAAAAAAHARGGGRRCVLAARALAGGRAARRGP